MLTHPAAEMPDANGMPSPFVVIKARSILGVWLGAALLALLGSGIPFTVLNPAIDKLELASWVLCFGVLGECLGVTYLLRRYAALGLPLEQLLGPRLNLEPRAFLRVVVMNLALAFGASLLPHLLAIYTGKWSTGPSDLFFLRDSDNLWTLLVLNPMNVLVAVALAPFCEELVFRALLLHRLSLKWGPKAAIWVSSLLFGLLHGLAPGIFLMGLSWALIYLATRGSLRTTILLHASHNLMVMLLSNVLIRMGLDLRPETSSGWLLAEVLLLALGGGLAWGFYREHLPTWRIWPPFLPLGPESDSAA